MEFVYKQYINEKWTEAESGRNWEVINPATGDIITSVPFGNSIDVRRAIDAAENVRFDWATKTPYERSVFLTRAARLVEKYLDLLALITTKECGKPLDQSKAEWILCAQLLDWFAEEGKRAYGRVIPSRQKGKRISVIMQPIGVIGTITAWNFPAYLPCRAWAAALSAGCTVVGRPSEITPMSAMALANILSLSGIPHGVFNLVNGEPSEMAEEMLNNPLCRKISFTGSTNVAKTIMRGAAETITKISLELGGSAPVIIFPDIDINKAAREAVIFKFRNCGQVCISPTRFFVHTDIERTFLEAVTEETRKLTVGNGAEPGIDVGPLINEKQLEYVEELVEDAIKKNAKLMIGGSRLTEGLFSRGYFFQPTVLGNLNQSMRVMQEEVFGPILPVFKFKDMDEVIKIANNTEYGLASHIWTNDLNTAIKVSERLEFGMVGINNMLASAVEGPFGGIKQSGIGRESGQEGLSNYLETKLITVSGEF